MKKKKAVPRIIPDGMTQANFNISLALMDRVTVLAKKLGVTKSDIYNAALAEYLKKQERK